MQRSKWIKEETAKKRCRLFWPNEVLGKIIIYDRATNKVLSIEAFNPNGQPKETHLLEYAFMKDGNYTFEQALKFWETESLCCFYTSISTSGLWKNQINETSIINPPATSVGELLYYDSLPKTFDEVVNTIEARRNSISDFTMTEYSGISTYMPTGVSIFENSSMGSTASQYLNYINSSSTTFTTSATSTTYSGPNLSYSYQIEDVEE